MPGEPESDREEFENIDFEPPVKVVALRGEMYQQTEKLMEYVDGELRGEPGYVEEYEPLVDSKEDLYRMFDYPPGAIALPMDGDEKEDQVGWFPDPDWEPS